MFILYRGATLRITYDNIGNFVSQDIEGGTARAPGLRQSLKIDSSYDQLSPVYLGNITNCLNYIFKYEDPLFRSSRGFTSMQYESYLNANKIPKAITLVNRNPSELKDYPEKHTFTFIKDGANKVSELNFESKYYYPDG